MFNGVRRSATPADLLDVNAIKNCDVTIESSASLNGCESRLPPQRRLLLQHRLRFLSSLRILGRVGKFLVTPLDDNARPLDMAPDFIGLHTYQGIQAHRLDLLPHGGKPIEVAGVGCEIDRHDVWLIVAGASKPSQNLALPANPHILVGSSLSQACEPPLSSTEIARDLTFTADTHQDCGIRD